MFLRAKKLREKIWFILTCFLVPLTLIALTPSFVTSLGETGSFLEVDSTHLVIIYIDLSIGEAKMISTENPGIQYENEFTIEIGDCKGTVFWNGEGFITLKDC